ncbi:hypothetical protein ACF0H5_009538 [Mactra antiquata]
MKPLTALTNTNTTLHEKARDQNVEYFMGNIQNFVLRDIKLHSGEIYSCIATKRWHCIWTFEILLATATMHLLVLLIQILIYMVDAKKYRILYENNSGKDPSIFCAAKASSNLNIGVKLEGPDNQCKVIPFTTRDVLSQPIVLKKTTIEVFENDEQLPFMPGTDKRGWKFPGVLSVGCYVAVFFQLPSNPAWESFALNLQKQDPSVTAKLVQVLISRALGVEIESSDMGFNMPSFGQGGFKLDFVAGVTYSVAFSIIESGVEISFNNGMYTFPVGNAEPPEQFDAIVLHYAMLTEASMPKIEKIIFTTGE